MYIELFGLPGSGKTTLVGQLVAQGGFEDARNKEWSRALRFMMRHPLATATLVRTTLRETKKSGTKKLLRAKLSLIFYTCAFLHKAAHAKEVAVVDEGILQRALSIFETKLESKEENKKEQQELERFLRRMPMPALVVFVEGDREQYFRRYTGDDGANIRSALAPEALEEWQRTVAHNYEVIRNTISRKDVFTDVTTLQYDWQAMDAAELAKQLRELTQMHNGSINTRPDTDSNSHSYSNSNSNSNSNTNL